MSELSFRFKERLHEGDDFRRAFKCGVKRNAGPFSLYFVRTEAFPRLGIVVSRFQGPAVDRNRAKRVIRDEFRHMKGELPEGDYLVRVRGKLSGGTPLKWRRALGDLWGRRKNRAGAPV